MVQAKSPAEEEKDKYYQLEVDQKKVYVLKNSQTENENIKITIDVLGFWFLKTLKVRRIDTI